MIFSGDVASGQIRVITKEGGRVYSLLTHITNNQKIIPSHLAVYINSKGGARCSPSEAITLILKSKPSLLKSWKSAVPASWCGAGGGHAPTTNVYACYVPCRWGALHVRRWLFLRR
jgi:hypothetical protein